PAASNGPTKQMQPADLKAWKGIRQSVLSNDGKWFAYVLAPNEGDALVVLRSTGNDAKETKFPIGEAGGGRGGPPGLGGGAWLAMQMYPDQPAAGGAAAGAAAGGRGGAAGAAAGTDLLLYNLTTGDAVNVGNVSEFGFDESGDWLAYTIDARDQIGNGVQLR